MVKGILTTLEVPLSITLIMFTMENIIFLCRMGQSILWDSCGLQHLVDLAQDFLKTAET